MLLMHYINPLGAVREKKKGSSSILFFQKENLFRRGGWDTYPLGPWAFPLVRPKLKWRSIICISADFRYCDQVHSHAFYSAPYTDIREIK